MDRSPFDDDLYDEDFDDDFDDEDSDDEPVAGESPFRSRPPIATARALDLLSDGEVSVLGRMPYSSNATFLVDVCHDGLLELERIAGHDGASLSRVPTEFTVSTTGPPR